MKQRSGNGNYFPFPRSIFKHEGFKKLSTSARLLFFYLLEAEHQYTGEKVGYFFRSNDDLSSDTGLSNKTIIEAKKEFKEHISDLIDMGWVHWWVDDKRVKKSKKKVTSFTIKV